MGRKTKMNSRELKSIETLFSRFCSNIVRFPV
jgi:hypothetical protein